VQLILMTGFRRGEALGIRRSWLLPAGGVDFPDTKAGPQIRPIGKAAIKLLVAQFALDDQHWAFPAERGEGHFVGLPKVLARLCTSAGLKRTTIHDLRHTFASIAADLGFSELVIAGLLGHRAGSVTSGYVHLDRTLAAAADRVSAVIANALDGLKRGEIVALPMEFARL
jgi:integrase